MLIINNDNLPSIITSDKTAYISDNRKQIALARFTLVRRWQDFRDSYSEKKAKADAKFIEQFNTGQFLPALNAVLKKAITRQTLYRWEQILGDSNDYMLLAPQYGKGAGKPKLDSIEEKILMGLILNPNKIKEGTAIRLLDYKLQAEGIKPKATITYRRYIDWFKKTRTDVYTFMREGQKALKDKVEPFIKRDPSLLNVGDVLVADGHRLNFQVINPFTGKPCRATLVGYLDWKSYDLAGYEIMVEENTQCIASALRNSIVRLGKLPKITYQDNGKAFRARFFTSTESFDESGIYGLFARLGIVPVFAKPYNARAKIIERWFKEFSDTFERLLPSFVGTSVADKPAYMLRNEKFHKAIHKEYIPTIEEAVQLIEAWLEFHRSQPCPHVEGKTIGEVFGAETGTVPEKTGQSPDVNAGQSLRELDDLMMAVKITRIDRNGIRFLKADYYDDNLYGLRDSAIIKYSLFDLSYIKVYSSSGDFLCSAKRVLPVHPMAEHLGDVKDVEELRQKLALQKRLERQTIRLSKELMLKQVQHDKEGMLDWQKVVEFTPRVIEKIEMLRQAQHDDLPAQALSIPEEAVKGTKGTVPNLPPSAGNSGTVPPIFAEAWQRYEDLIQQHTLTEEERLWIERYRTTDEFRFLYGDVSAAG